MQCTTYFFLLLCVHKYCVQASQVTEEQLKDPETKLSWIFDAFDTDGGGSIDSEEIRDIVEVVKKIMLIFLAPFRLRSYGVFQ